MKIIADTHVLVRAVVRDDIKPAKIAEKILMDAELIAVGLPCLCEFVWVLRKVYGFKPIEVADSIRTLIATDIVAVNRAAVEAGLCLLESGGDFADGVIAYEGNWLGGETFVSFDKKAVALPAEVGQSSHLL